MRTASTGPAPTGIVLGNADVALGTSIIRRGGPSVDATTEEALKGPVAYNVTAVAAPGDAHVMNRTRCLGGNGRIRGTEFPIYPIRLHIDDVAGAANPWAHRLRELDANLSHTGAISGAPGLDIHRNEGMPRVWREMVSETDGVDVAQFHNEQTWIGLRCDIRHRGGCLDRKNAGATVYPRRDVGEHRRVDPGATRRERGPSSPWLKRPL